MRNIGSTDIVVTKSACGHRVSVWVPPHRPGGPPGPKGMQRVALANSRKCVVEWKDDEIVSHCGWKPGQCCGRPRILDYPSGRSKCMNCLEVKTA